MKIVRFVEPCSKAVRYGKVSGRFVLPYTESPFGARVTFTGEKLCLSEVRLLAPCLPSKVVLVGLNYTDHAREMGMPIPDEPLIFLKPASAVIGPGEKIIIPDQARQVDYEGELGVVIGKTCSMVSERSALRYILGYTCVNDVTARDIQKRESQWTRAKSFDTFCPIGAFIETDADPSKLNISLTLNGKTMQRSNTKNLIFPVRSLISFVSGIMTLFPGDIISTGTPPGVGPMKPGDVVRVNIEHVGELENTVAGLDANSRK